VRVDEHENAKRRDEWVCKRSRRGYGSRLSSDTEVRLEVSSVIVAV
jgi:hypothetical protein